MWSRNSAINVARNFLVDSLVTAPSPGKTSFEYWMYASGPWPCFCRVRLGQLGAGTPGGALESVFVRRQHRDQHPAAGGDDSGVHGVPGDLRDHIRAALDHFAD
jgi:hypothetical protein